MREMEPRLKGSEESGLGPEVAKREGKIRVVNFFYIKIPYSL